MQNTKPVSISSHFDDLRLDYGGRESNSFNFQRRNHKNWKPIFTQRKVKLLLTEKKIRSFTYLVYNIKHFFQWRKHNVKNSTQSLPTRLLLMSKHPVGDENDMNNPSLPKEFQHLVKDEKVHKIVLYDKTERLSECFKVHMKDFLPEFNCYELFDMK